jgi:anti-anti-sigma factor
MLGSLEIDQRGDTAIARLVGEVDASNAPGFTAELKAVIPNSAIGVVLDLSETSYIDSSGLHLIFDLADALRRRQQTLQLVVPADTFASDVLAAVNIDGAARVSDTMPAALEAVRQPTF